MNHEYENIIRLEIRSDKVSSDEMIERIGFTPDRTWQPGDLVNQKGLVKFKDHGCRVETSKIETDSWGQLFEDFSQFVEGLDVYKDALKKISEHEDVKVSFVLIQYVKGAQLGYRFGPKILKKVADFGAELSLDLYSLPTD